MPKRELISLVFEMGYTIAIPIVIFALGGRYLDRKLNSSPLFLLVGIFFALVSTGFLVYRKIKKINT